MRVEVIVSDRILIKHFSVHHVIIVECSSGFKPSPISLFTKSRNNHFSRFIANQYIGNSSIVNTKRNPLNNYSLNISSFSSDQVTVHEVNPIIKHLDSKEFPGTGKR